MVRLTKKQKQIVSYFNPRYGKFASTKEIQEARLLAKGKYWHYPDYQDGEPVYYEYVSFSPEGVRKFFEYDFYSPISPQIFLGLKSLMRKAAYYWAVGKKKISLELEDQVWYWYDNFTYTVSKQKSFAGLKKLQKKYGVSGE